MDRRVKRKRKRVGRDMIGILFTCCFLSLFIFLFFSIFPCTISCFLPVICVISVVVGWLGGTLYGEIILLCFLVFLVLEALGQILAGLVFLLSKLTTKNLSISQTYIIDCFHQSPSIKIGGNSNGELNSRLWERVVFRKHTYPIPQSFPIHREIQRSPQG